MYKVSKRVAGAKIVLKFLELCKTNLTVFRVSEYSVNISPLPLLSVVFSGKEKFSSVLTDLCLLPMVLSLPLSILLLTRERVGATPLGPLFPLGAHTEHWQSAAGHVFLSSLPEGLQAGPALSSTHLSSETGPPNGVCSVSVSL